MKQPPDGTRPPSKFGSRHFSYSPKNEQIIAFQSDLEDDFHYLLEYDKKVDWYRVQPCTAHASINGKWGRSIPDFLIHAWNGEFCYAEVKYTADLLDPKSRAHRQIAIQKAWCLENGYKHIVVTEKYILSCPVLLNSLRTLFRWFTPESRKSLAYASPLLQGIIDLILDNPFITFGDLSKHKPSGVDADLFNFATAELIRRRLVDAELAAVAFGPHSRLRAKKVLL